MAIYHFHVKVFSRTAGHSSVAAAAYRSREKLTDERAAELNKTLEPDRQLKEVHDYTRRSGWLHSEIVAPEHAPGWARDRYQLWNKVEAAEKLPNSQLAREVEVALPRELDLDTNQELVRQYVQEHFVSLGMVADISIHDKTARDGQGNPHAHIMLTMREIDGDAFSATKNRDWNRVALLNEWREGWAEHVNGYLERAGFDERIDHRTLEEQGIERQPEHVNIDALHIAEHSIEQFAIAVEPEPVQQEIEQLTTWQRVRESTLAWYDQKRETTIAWYGRTREAISQWRNPPPEKDIEHER